MRREFCCQENRNDDGSTGDHGKREPALRRSMRNLPAHDCGLRNCRRGGIERALNLIDRPALGRIATKAILRDFAEWVRERGRNCWVFLLLIPNRRSLSQRFHKNYAKRPYVGGWRQAMVINLGREVNRWSARGAYQIASSVQPVARDLQLIVASEDVRRFEMTMHEVVSMQVS